jgi:hypothetical protein
LVSDGLNDGDNAFSDSTETWNNLPSNLINADYIQTGKEDNSNSDLEVTVSFNADGTLFAFHADSISTPSWLTSNFSDTGETIDLAGSTSGTYSIFSQTLSAGSTFTFLDNDPNTTNSGLMYGIAATATADDGGPNGDIPVPATFALLGIGLIGIGAARSCLRE